MSRHPQRQLDPHRYGLMIFPPLSQSPNVQGASSTTSRRPGHQQDLHRFGMMTQAPLMQSMSQAKLGAHGKHSSELWALGVYS